MQLSLGRPSQRAARILALALVTAGLSALAANPPSASAVDNSLNLSFTPQTVKDNTTLVVTASGYADPASFLGVWVKLVPAAGGCPAYQRAAEVATKNFAIAEDISGSFSESGEAGPNPAGSYLLCGWMQQAFDRTSAVLTAQVPVTVTSSSGTTPRPPDPDPQPEPEPNLKCQKAQTSLAKAKRKVTSTRKAMKGKKGKAKSKAKKRYKKAVRARDRAQGRVDALCS